MVKFVSFNDFTDTMFSLSNFKYLNNGTNSNDHRKLLKVLNNIINNELTEKQKKCIYMYYMDNLNTTKISKILGVYPSTVWRHIKKSKQKIKKIIKYYYDF